MTKNSSVCRDNKKKTKKNLIYLYKYERQTKNDDKSF